MAKTSITRAQALAYIVDMLADNPDFVQTPEMDAACLEVAMNMLAQLRKQSSKPKSMTKEQMLNASLDTTVLEWMRTLGKDATVSTVMIRDKFGVDVPTTQKATGCMTRLIKGGMVERVIVKGRTFYKLTDAAFGGDE